MLLPLVIADRNMAVRRKDGKFREDKCVHGIFKRAEYGLGCSVRLFFDNETLPFQVAFLYECQETGYDFTADSKVNAKVILLTAYCRTAMDAMLFVSQERKPILQFLNRVEKRRDGLVAHHGHDVMRASDIIRPEIPGFIYENVQVVQYAPETKKAGISPPCGEP